MPVVPSGVGSSGNGPGWMPPGAVARPSRYLTTALAAPAALPSAAPSVVTRTITAGLRRDGPTYLLVCGRAKRHKTFRRIFSRHGDRCRFRKAEPANVYASAPWRCGRSPFSGLSVTPVLAFDVDGPTGCAVTSGSTSLVWVLSSASLVDVGLVVIVP